MDKWTEEQTRRQIESHGSKPNDKKSSSPAIPRPSSSVLLISPTNQVLLLQRVKQSTSFASAHVFPGGNVSTYHDTASVPSPQPSSPTIHQDSETYRLAAIRETFEESGILLARNNGFGRLLELSETEREAGRKIVHSNQRPFLQWLASKGGRPDVDGLLPFTRWITPTNVPKRFSTQMYLYFLPTVTESSDTNSAQVDREKRAEDEEREVTIPVPTTDGGLEHTTARFLPAATWCRLAQEGRVILFPPQFFLLHQVSKFLDELQSPGDYASLQKGAVVERKVLEGRRKKLMEFVKSGSPPWTDKVISPQVLGTRDGGKRDDGRAVLGLNKPGHELAGTDREGVKDECVLVEFRKEGPRKLAVVNRSEALDRGPKATL